MFEIDLEKYDHTCYIVGGGTSLKDFNWELLKDKFVIAINSAYTKLPHAQILYCTDPPWIQEHLTNLENFKGTIYQGTLTLERPGKLPVVDKQWHLTGVEGLETKENSLKHGSNSTYAALNMMTVHFGFKNVYLLGIDQKWGTATDKTTSHWHTDTPHKRVDPESVYTKMMQAYKSINQPLLDMGVNVYNINTPDGTALDVFPIISREEHFNLT